MDAVNNLSARRKIEGSCCSREADAKGNIIVSSERRREMEDSAVIASGAGTMQGYFIVAR